MYLVHMIILCKKKKFSMKYSREKYIRNTYMYIFEILSILEYTLLNKTMFEIYISTMNSHITTNGQLKFYKFYNGHSYSIYSLFAIIYLSINYIKQYMNPDSYYTGMQAELFKTYSIQFTQVFLLICWILFNDCWNLRYFVKLKIQLQIVQQYVEYILYGLVEICNQGHPKNENDGGRKV